MYHRRASLYQIMSKTLIVHYTPRGERSKTKRVLDLFRSSAQGQTEFLEHDLADDPPEMFLRDNLMAYVMRNMAGEVNPAYDAALVSLDRMVAEIKQADFVVLAFPLYNYSVPAVVKAWLDSVVVSGETFMMEGGRFKGLMAGREALILSTAGASAYMSPGAEPDFGRPLAVKCFEFMGYHVTNIQVDGANQLPPEDYESLLIQKGGEIQALTQTWYGQK